MIYACPITDLNAAWRTPSGAALLDAALGTADEPSNSTMIDGAESMELDGDPASIAALVGGLLGLKVRVYQRSEGGVWTRIFEAPVQPEVEDDEPGTDDDDEHPSIDPEFSSLCGMLSSEERGALYQSILTHGCREPLVVWAEKQLLLDGHNRLSICRELSKSYRTVEYSFPTRDAARIWIIDNALARRNLTPAQASYLRGRRYLAERKDPLQTLEQAAARGQAPLGQNDQAETGPTAARLARASGVSPKTLRRDAEYAQAIDRLAASAGQRVRSDILSGRVKVTRKQVALAAEQGVRTLRDLRAVGRIPAGARTKAEAIVDLATRLARHVEDAPGWVTPADTEALQCLWDMVPAIEALAARLGRDVHHQPQKEPDHEAPDRSA